MQVLQEGTMQAHFHVKRDRVGRPHEMPAYLYDHGC